MAQSKVGSATETVLNIGIGFVVSYVGNYFIMPVFGFHSMSASQNLGLTCFFTALSLARTYILRRIFNRIRWQNNDRTSQAV